jgi:serine acetyltransferase
VAAAAAAMSVNGGRTSGEHGFFSLIRADYVAGFAFKAESPAELRLKYLPRLLTNASLHAVLLVRLMQFSPRVLAWIWRRVMISMHACDIPRDCEIGPGLQLPHPVGICIGANTIIGRNVVIHQHSSIGPYAIGQWAPRPGQEDELGWIRVEDGVKIFANAIVLGEITVGTGSVVGAQTLLTQDLPPGHAYIKGKIRPLSDQDEEVR